MRLGAGFDRLVPYPRYYRSQPARLRYNNNRRSVMSASATPKQGDHVFNAVEIAIMRPFESIRALRSALVDGEHFLHDYLLHSYSMARNMADAPVLVAARNLVALAGAEEDSL